MKNEVSALTIPTGVANSIGRLYRNFLWGGLVEEFKYHLAKWDKACTPLAYGGWGFENLPLSVNLC